MAQQVMPVQALAAPLLIQLRANGLEKAMGDATKTLASDTCV